MTTLDNRLADLTTMPPARLRSARRDTFKSPTPDIGPDLFRRGIANRLQERVHCSLNEPNVNAARSNRNSTTLFDPYGRGACDVCPGLSSLKVVGTGLLGLQTPRSPGIRCEIESGGVPQTTSRETGIAKRNNTQRNRHIAPSVNRLRAGNGRRWPVDAYIFQNWQSILDRGICVQ